MLAPISAKRWDFKTAAHLLNRAGFGGTPVDIQRLVNLGPAGAVAALVDAAMSQAVRSTVDPGVAVATISMTLNYLAPAHGELACAGTVVRGGKSIVFAEAEVADGRGKAVCRATATYRVLPSK